MGRILIIEDEQPMARFLQLELEHEGFAVELAFDGEAGLNMALGQSFDCILLDVMLPRMDGITVCRELRKHQTTPVLMLTARGSIRDRVEGLDCGADDYLVKPFAIEEVLARLRSLQRRVGRRVPPVHRILDLTLAPDTRRVARGGREIALSAREYELLRYMVEHQGSVLSRETLLLHVWGFQFRGETNVVDVYIRYLRAKIDEPFETKLIHTVRGCGYVLRGRE